MGKKRTVDVSADNETLPAQNRRNIPMTDVKRVPPQELMMNRINQEYFDVESEKHLYDPREDIRRRGIIVPLIAKRDGTLLAGHNRLMIAREINLKLVPVQYVQEELTEEQEREFIIKDNILRRQLSQEKRITLYKKVYPEFEATFLSDKTRNVGGRTKNGQSNRLTIARIAEETGQKEETVKKQIQLYRKKRGEQFPPLAKKNQSTQQKPKNGYEISSLESKSGALEKTNIVKAARQIAKDLEQASDKEKKEVLAIFRKILNVKKV